MTYGWFLHSISIHFRLQLICLNFGLCAVWYDIMMTKTATLCFPTAASECCSLGENQRVMISLVAPDDNNTTARESE